MELTAEITDACRNECVHCSSRSGPRSSTFLPVEMIKNAIDEIHPDRIVLSGGEPFLHPDLAEIIDISKASGATLAINTCGVIGIDDVPKNIAHVDEMYVSWFKDDNETITRSNQPLRMATPLSITVIPGIFKPGNTWLNVVMVDPVQIIDVPFAAYHLAVPVHLVRLVMHGRATSLIGAPSLIEQRGMALSIMRQLDPSRVASRIPLFLRHDGYKRRFEFETIKDECLAILEAIHPRCKISHSLIGGACRALEKRTLLPDGRIIGCVAGKGRDETIGHIKACDG